MNILLTGMSGYVGGIISRELSENYNIVGVNRSTVLKNNVLCDLSDYESVRKLNSHHPDIVIHAAGNKDIRFCENDPEAAYSSNTQSMINLLRVFGGKSRIIYLSTDYVFAGNRGGYAEQDLPAPLTEYGRSKYKAEIACNKAASEGVDVTIIRLSALYDLVATFPKYLLGCLERNEVVECYSNIYYSPTYYRDFIRLLSKVIVSDSLPGNIFHSCGSRVSRYDFAKQLCTSFGFDANLIVSSIYEEKNTFLFHDLSLENSLTEKQLGVSGSDMGMIMQELLDKNEKN